MAFPMAKETPMNEKKESFGSKFISKKPPMKGKPKKLGKKPPSFGFGKKVA